MKNLNASTNTSKSAVQIIVDSNQSHKISEKLTSNGSLNLDIKGIQFTPNNLICEPNQSDKPAIKTPINVNF